MGDTVFVLGGAQTDFAQRSVSRGATMSEYMVSASLAAMTTANIDAVELDSLHIGSAATGDASTLDTSGRALVRSIPAVNGIPMMRHEAGGASGSAALLAAVAEISSGRSDVVMVVGAEVMTVTSGAGDRHSHRGFDRCRLDRLTEFDVRDHCFDQVAEIYRQRYGLSQVHLDALRTKALDNARNNPLARSRGMGTDATSASAISEVEHDVSVSLNVRDTDGAAAVILASPRFAHRWAQRTGTSLDRLARIDGWGYRTCFVDPPGSGDNGDDLLFPQVRATMIDAMSRAGIANVDEFDLMEVHDSCSLAEYVAIDHLGITAPGQSWQAVESGSCLRTGTLPMNPSGGLTGIGHPLGATGVRMVWDASRQVCGLAGEAQVAQASRALALNASGAFATVAAFVVIRG